MAPISIPLGILSQTHGPKHRYTAVLFIEKEGFGPLFRRARIAERFDIAIMSTKGMSTTAARLLVDRLTPQIDKVLVLHYFDVSGFSIFGTLGSDGRRYQFQNTVNLIDIGLRLDDVQSMNLQSEPVETSGDWSTRAKTLRAHGACSEKIRLLQHRRVELNAMPAGVFIDFLERKLREHGVHKVTPSYDVLQEHARQVLERQLICQLLEKFRPKCAARRKEADCPATSASR